MCNKNNKECKNCENCESKQKFKNGDRVRSTLSNEMWKFSHYVNAQQAVVESYGRPYSVYTVHLELVKDKKPKGAIGSEIPYKDSVWTIRNIVECDGEFYYKLENNDEIMANLVAEFSIELDSKKKKEYDKKVYEERYNHLKSKLILLESHINNIEKEYALLCDQCCDVENSLELAELNRLDLEKQMNEIALKNR